LIRQFKKSKPYSHFTQYFIPSNLLALAALAIAFVSLEVNYQMKDISQKQDSTSVSIDTFKKLLLKTDVLITQQSKMLKNYDSQLNSLRTLLSKTDTVISVSDSQLELNKKYQRQSAKGDENRFIASLFRIGANLMYRDSAKSLENHEEEQTAQDFSHRMLPIFEGQMNNQFLCNDNQMLRLWVNAYAHLNILRHEGVYSREFSKSFDVSSDNRIDEMTNVELLGNFMSVWKSIDTALIFCSKKVGLKNKTYIKN